MNWVPLFLHYIQDTWKPSGGVAVTGFGFAEPFEVQKSVRADILFDPIRSGYYRDHMEAILIAISEVVNVVGTLAWSILDNLEWNSGYQDKFGVQYVNLITQERSYKASFFEYVNAFQVYVDFDMIMEKPLPEAARLSNFRGFSVKAFKFLVMLSRSTPAAERPNLCLTGVADEGRGRFDELDIRGRNAESLDRAHSDKKISKRVRSTVQSLAKLASPPFRLRRF